MLCGIQLCGFCTSIISLYLRINVLIRMAGFKIKDWFCSGVMHFTSEHNLELLSSQCIYNSLIVKQFYMYLFQIGFDNFFRVFISSLNVENTLVMFCTAKAP